MVKPQFQKHISSASLTYDDYERQNSFSFKLPSLLYSPILYFICMNKFVRLCFKCYSS